MLYIIYNTSENITESKWWYVGEPVPEINARVVEFQAFGDELTLILDALGKTRHALAPTPSPTPSVPALWESIKESV